jgi:uncharacterized membrane protein YsdA (DUF1294 family)
MASSVARAMSGRGRWTATPAPVLFATAIWALATIVGFAAGLPPYLAWLVGGSVATLLLYGADKWQAQRGGWRVPERVLFALALAGGVAGAWAGMFLFRHKTQHAAFYVVNGIATVLHLALAAWLLAR